jgi:hypothetical protein
MTYVLLSDRRIINNTIMSTDQTIKTRKIPLDAISKLIESGDETQFVGIEETANFEFKEFSYKTASPGDDKHKAHMELAKDITAISNAGGGLLCIGLKPGQKHSVNVEYVDSVTGVEEADIHMQSWAGVLSDWIVPRFSISYLKCGFMGKSKKVFWINIPSAKEIGQFPFIIAKDQYSPETGISIKGRIFGYYTRDGAEDLLLAPDKIRKYISDGLKAENEPTNTQADTSQLNSEIKALNLKVDSLSSQIATISLPQQEADYTNMEKKITEYASTRIGGSKGYFYIYAIPVNPIKIKDFWRDDEKSISYAIKHTPILRNMGWSLEVADSEHPYTKSDSWEIMNGDRKILLVKRSGEIFTAGAIDGFLDWSVAKEESTADDSLKLVNAFAFTEYVDLFFKFFVSLRKDFNLKTDYIIKTGFILPNGMKLAMERPAHIGNTLFSSRSNALSIDCWTFKVQESDDRSHALMAGEIVMEINASGFGWVGGDNPYPYLKKGPDGYEVDEDFYRKNVTV